MDQIILIERRTTPEIKDGNKKIKKTFEFDRHEDSFIDIFQPSNINKKKKNPNELNSMANDNNYNNHKME